MNKSPRLFIGLFLVALTTVFTQCPKDYYPPSPQFSFKQSVDIAPYALNYSVGDTVWVQLYVPGKSLFDTISNKYVLYDSANFSTDVRVQLLFNDPFIANGARLVSFVYTPGISAYESFNQSVTDAQVSFGCNQATDYNLLVGIVFQQKGVFGVSLSGSVQKCFSTTYSYKPLNFYFNVPDGHFDYYSQLPFADINQQPDGNILYALMHKSVVCVNVQ
jgi:hypothetical protein